MFKRAVREVLSSPVITLFVIVLLVAILTWFIPAGQYERVYDEASGVTVIQGDSFHYVEKNNIGFMQFFNNIHLGFMAGAEVIFMCFFSSFYIRVITESGAFAGGITTLINKVGRHKKLIIPVIIVIISLAGFSYGETEDLYPLIPLFVATAAMAGYNSVVGVAISGGAVMIGFAASAFNPYTIGVAQNIAELPLYSGALFRTIMYVVFLAVYIWWVMRYAAKNPLLPEEEQEGQIHIEPTQFTTQHKIILLGFAVVVAMMIIGALNWGWYFTEIAALFLMGGVLTSIFLRHRPTRIAELALNGFKDIMMGVIVIGLARSILVMLNHAMVIDTVINSLFQAVQLLPSVLFPIGMLLVQTLFNFLIPSGSGQAAAIMPIMTPLADLLGVNRQIAVLAFQMGDGFSNMLWPTCSIAVICGIAKVPLQKWYKLLLPFYGIMLLLQFAILLFATAIDLGPF